MLAAARSEAIENPKGEAAVQRRVALVIANLGWGGAQKVMVGLANFWAERGWSVTIISMDHALPTLYFPPHPAVTIVYLSVSSHSRSKLGAIAQNFFRFRALRRAIVECKAELVVSFLSGTNVRTLIATAGMGLPVIVSERGDPLRDTLPKVWRFLRGLTYPFAFRLVAQTEAALGCFNHMIRRRGIVIPNPVEIRSSPISANHRTVVAVGHLVPVKGFDILVEAFALCAERHPDWRLVIWGEGPQCRDLEALAKRLGVSDRTAMPGRSAEPGGWIEEVGIYVLASRHEGFPNALAEAMAAGLPVIATDCPVGGPRTLITHEQNGLLVANENVQALATALDKLMSDPAARQRFGDAAHRSVQRYDAATVMARWTGLVEQGIQASR